MSHRQGPALCVCQVAAEIEGDANKQAPFSSLGIAQDYWDCLYDVVVTANINRRTGLFFARCCSVRLATGEHLVTFMIKSAAV